MTEFRVRLLRTGAVLAALAALYVGGLLFSPERVRARAEEKPLLALPSTAAVRGIDLVFQGVTRLALRRQGERWEVQAGGPPVFPANAGRVESLLAELASLPRGPLVSRDPGRDAGLGLSADAARLLLLHRDGGQPDVGLLVGERGPGGGEDYVRVRGEPGVYLARGSLSVRLTQDRPYWYDLHVLPDDVRGTTIGRVRVRGTLELGPAGGGRLEADYTLAREAGGEWALAGSAGEARPADRLAAGAMANSLALLEGEDFLEALAAAGRPAAPEPPAGGTLEVEVATLGGSTYVLHLRGVPGTGQALVTTNASPWTFLVNAAPLRRALRPASELLAKR